MDIRTRLQTLIKETLGTETPFSLEWNSDLSRGDLSTNVAFVASKGQGSPKERAEQYAALLVEKRDPQLVEKIEVAGAGFINFFLTTEAIRLFLSDLEVGRNIPNPLKGQKVIIEHTQPNPFKEFHIGHLMNNTIGEAVARLYKTLGAETKVVSYHGDKGLHVAKAIWALKQGVSYKEAYAFGNKRYDEDPSIKKEIEDINMHIYKEDDSETLALYKKGMAVFVEDFTKATTLLGSAFDRMFFESKAGEVGVTLVKEHPEVFVESEGAVVFKGEDFVPKTHTRVFINSQGLPTYEAKELGLSQLKKDFFNYDTSVTITGNEQDAFFKVVEVATGEVFPDRKGKLYHLSHGMLRLPEGKMSSRTGNVILALDFIEQISGEVREKMKERVYDYDTHKLVEEISVAAFKYAILRQKIGGDIVFDFNTSISFEGDSGPYLQYSAVRAGSLLRKGAEKGMEPTYNPEQKTLYDFERKMAGFYDCILRAGNEHAPHYIATYLVELASLFNAFYHEGVIIDEANKETTMHKLYLVSVFKEVMTSGLWLLGITVPEEM